MEVVRKMKQGKKNVISFLSVMACSALAFGLGGLRQSNVKAEEGADYSASFFVRSASLRETDTGFAPAVNYKTVIEKSVFLEKLAKKDGENVVKGENGNWEVLDGVTTYTVFAQTSTLAGADLTLANGKAVDTTDHWFEVEYDGVEYLECIAYVDEIPAANFTSDISVVSVIDIPEGYGDDIYSGTVLPQSLSDIAQLALDQEVTTADKVEAYLSFEVNYWVDGQKVNTEQKKLGDKLTQPANPTAQNKWFYNAWLNKDGTGAWDFEENTVTGPVNLYADMRSRPIGSIDSNPVSQIFSADAAKVTDATTKAALESEIQKNGFVAEVVNDGDWPTWPSTFVNLFCGSLDTYLANYKAYMEDGSNRYLVVKMFMPKGLEWNDIYYTTGDFNSNTNWGKMVQSMSQIKGGQWVSHIFDLSSIYQKFGEATSNPWFFLRTKSKAKTMEIGGKNMSVTYISDVYFLDAGETVMQHTYSNNIDSVATDGNTWNSIISDASDAMLKDAATQAALAEELKNGSTITELYRCDERTWANNWLYFNLKYPNWTTDLAGKYLVLRVYIREDMTEGASFKNFKGVAAKMTVSAGWVDYYFSMDEIIASNAWGFQSFAINAKLVDLDGDGTAKESVVYFAGYRIADELPQ